MIDDAASAKETSAQLSSLYRLSLSILHAQDAVQQGVMRAWERRAQVREDRLRAWLMRIVGSAFMGDHRAPIAACLDAQGNTRWTAELHGVSGEAAGVRCAMPLEGGDILLFIRRQKTQGQDILYYNHEQVRLSADGEVLETIPLRTATEIFDMSSDVGCMAVYPGHGGFIVSSSMGPRNIPCVAQLDERGETVFAMALDDLRQNYPVPVCRAGRVSADCLG